MTLKWVIYYFNLPYSEIHSLIHQHRITLIILFLFSSCVPPPQENEQLLGIWLGQYQDESMQLPLPSVFYFDNDSIVYWLKEDFKIYEQKWNYTDQYLNIDTNVFSINTFDKTRLILEQDYNYYYQKRNKPSLSQAETAAQQDILNRQKSWKKTISKGKGVAGIIQYAWINDTLWQQESLYYQNNFLCKQSTPCIFKFEQLKEHHFLLEALFTSNQDTFQNSISEVIKWESDAFKTNKDFYQEGQPFEIENKFTLCQPPPVASYRFVDCSYKGGTAALEKYFFNQYKEIDEVANGFITIRFTVNCHGEIGDFELEQCDDEFEPIQFDRDIVEQLFHLTTKLTEWNVGKNEEKENVDSRFFVGFKIEHGKLMAVLP